MKLKFSEFIEIRKGYDRWFYFGLAIIWISVFFASLSNYELKNMGHYLSLESSFGMSYAWSIFPPVVPLLIQWIRPTILGWLVNFSYVLVFTLWTIITGIQNAMQNIPIKLGYFRLYGLIFFDGLILCIIICFFYFIRPRKQKSS